MSNCGFDILVVSNRQSLGTGLVGPQGNLEINIVLSGSEGHLLLVPIIKLEGHLVSTCLHVLSQENQVRGNWWRSNEEIEKGFVESEIFELALAVADSYWLTLL